MAAMEAGYPKHEEHPHPDTDPWQVATAVTSERLEALNTFLNAVPEGFAVDTKLEKGFLGGRRAARPGSRRRDDPHHASP